MIRQANIKDVPEILRMVHNFYKEGPFLENGLTFDTDSAQEFIEKMINNPKDRLLLVAIKNNEIVGTLGACKAGWMANKNQFQIMELWFWIEPEFRGFSLARQLIKVLESAAEQCGAIGVKLTAIETKDQDRIGNLYKYLGYKPSDKLHRKEINYA